MKIIFRAQFIEPMMCAPVKELPELMCALNRKYEAFPPPSHYDLD